MAKTQNNMVKAKTKRTSKGTRNRKKLDARVVGFDLGKFSSDILSNRRAKGLTQRELAANVGLTSAAIVFVENGRSNMLVGNFAKLVQFFKLNPANYIPAGK